MTTHYIEEAHVVRELAKYSSTLHNYFQVNTVGNTLPPKECDALLAGKSLPEGNSVKAGLWTGPWTGLWTDQNSCIQTANVTKAMKGRLQLCLKLLPSLLPVAASSPRYPRGQRSRAYLMSFNKSG